MEKETQQILKELQDGNPEVRLHAVEKLALLKDPRFVTYLIEMLGDPEWRVRKTAVIAVTNREQNEHLAEQLIQVLYLEGNVGKRNAAEESLIQIGRVGLPLLLTHLRMADKDVKKILIEILGEIGDKQAVQELIMALNDVDENVRGAAIEALGKLRDVRAVEVLIPLLQTENPLIRFTAVKALERIGDERAVGPIIRIANKKGLERGALEALGTFANPAVVAPILTALQEGSQKVKESALKALVDHYERIPPEHQRGVTDRLRQAYDKKAAIFLLEALDQSDEKVRLAAVKALGWMGDATAASRVVKMIDSPLCEDAVKALIRMKQGAADVLLQELAAAAEVTREGIARVFGEIGDRRSVNALIRLLNDPNGHVRQTAALALGRIQDPSSAKAIVDLLADQYVSVQESAIQALGLLKNPVVVARLIELLESDKPALRCNAIKVIGKMKAAEALPKLAFCLKDEDPTVRRSAVEALSEFEGPEVAHLLVLALADEDPTVRLTALTAAGRHREIDFLKQIDPLLTDDNIWVRSAVARELGERKDETVKTLLLGMLKDKVGVVQIAVMEALGKFKDGRLVPPIFEMAASHDPDVVKSAIAVLGEIGDTGIARRIQVFLEHKNWGIRATAAQALGKLKDLSARESLERMAQDDPDRLVQQSARFALARFTDEP
ncbi:MAG: HEAT repeat domain-containing protein [Nitrospirae bacterium]|nr:HEAT repeat domain-containing protein [Nitrospirota bacterium]